MEFGHLLEGVKVVELATYIAAPIATRVMADWGADVVKVEGPGGDPMRGYSDSVCRTGNPDEAPLYQFENANKRGIALNLKEPAGMEALHRLLAEADIFVTNTRDKALQKMGLDYETLSAQYPKLIWAHVTGLGEEGPEAAKPGFDITAFWARSGALLDVAQPGQPPVTCPSGVGDHTLGLGLVAGCLAALVRQRATGQGERVTMSLIGTATYAYATMALAADWGDPWPKARTDAISPLNTSYCCGDGEWFMCTIIDYNRHYPILMKALGLDELIDDERFNTFKEMVKEGRRLELMGILDKAFASKPRPEWVRIFEEADIPSETVRHFRDITSDPQGWANGNLAKFTFRTGKEIVMPATPVQFATNVAPPNEPAPLVGEHNDEVLAGLGYSADEIKGLYDSGAVFTA